MQKFLLSGMLLVLLCSQTVLAQKTQQLSNDKKLKNWYAFSAENGKQKHATDLFSYDDGIIQLFGPKAGYLMSKKAYRNFELLADYRWNESPDVVRKSSKRNSGLMYLVPETTKDTLWPQGIQFQIKQGATGDFILLQGVTVEQNGVQTEAGRSVAVKKSEEAENEFGKWNQLRVRVENGRIEQWLNGKLVNQAEAPSVSEGRILLQYEGYPIDFKKISIQQL